MSKLTQEEKLSRLAARLGWLDIHTATRRGKRHPDGAFLWGTKDLESVNYPRDYSPLPDYFGDLAAALGAVKHAVTELLDEDQVILLGRLVAGRYASDTLSGSDEEVHYAFANMLAGLAAADYAEPLGLALGLWKEGE